MNQLEQIEQRWAKATPGPWLPVGSYSPIGERDEYDNHVDIMNADMTTESFIGPMGDDDATAIANAPTDIEYLLRRLKAAEAVIADFDENCEHWAFDQEHFIAWREVAE